MKNVQVNLSYEDLQLKIVEEEIKANKLRVELYAAKRELDELKRAYENVVFEKEQIENSTIWKKTSFLRKFKDRTNKTGGEQDVGVDVSDNDTFLSMLDGINNDTDSTHIKTLMLLNNVEDISYIDINNIYGFGIYYKDLSKLSFIENVNKKYFLVFRPCDFMDCGNKFTGIDKFFDNDLYLRSSISNKAFVFLDGMFDKEAISSIRSRFDGEIELSGFGTASSSLDYEVCSGNIEYIRQKFYENRKIIPFINVSNAEKDAYYKDIYLFLRAVIAYSLKYRTDCFLFVDSSRCEVFYKILSKCEINIDNYCITPTYYSYRYKNRTIRYIGCDSDNELDYKNNLCGSCRIAVQAHVFYPELVDEIIEYTNNIPYKFDLYVSTVDVNKKLYISKKLEEKSKANSWEVEYYENIGRDVIPFLRQLSPLTKKYDYFCHIHTKRSFQNDIGDKWRVYLFDNLLGNVNVIKEIVNMFEVDSRLGLVFPETYSYVKGSVSIANNMSRMEELFRKLDMNINLKDDDSVNFPAGDMFWGRFDALHNLFEIDFNLKEVPTEHGQTDDTIFHAIERHGVMWLIIMAMITNRSGRLLMDISSRKTVNCVIIFFSKLMPFYLLFWNMIKVFSK